VSEIRDATIKLQREGKIKGNWPHYDNGEGFFKEIPFETLAKFER